MENFDFYNPTKIVFGKASIQKLSSELVPSNPQHMLILYSGSYVEESGLLTQVKQALTIPSMTVQFFSEIIASPPVSLVKKIVDIFNEQMIDFILAIGGGSVIDVAKAVAVELADSSIDITDVMMGNMEVSTSLPVGVISTISGSGSESSCSIVLTVDEGNLKRSYDSDLMRPKFAILDPELTYSLPSYQMISGGCDILMHTLDRYFSPSKHTDLIDQMSEGLLRVVMDSILRCYKDPYDYEARCNLMWGGSLSHNGLMETGRIPDWSAHRLEHELSSMFHVVHGAGLCAIWESWAMHVYRNHLDRFVDFARDVMRIEEDYGEDYEIARKGIETFINFFRKVHMPTNLRELGLPHISDAEIETMAENCLLLTQGSIGTLQPLYKEDIVQIYKNARG